jgi:hypothetical protein
LGKAIKNSERLRRKIRLISGGMDQAAEAFWTHPRLRDFFPEFLAMNYSISQASVPLMEAAITAARARSKSDAVAACLAEYLSRHIPEEVHHDDWLLNDLEVLGLEREQIRQRIASPTSAALVGVQYYWIFHAHPVSLLGYLAVLEGEPPSRVFLREIITRTRLPENAFTTYMRHSDLDRQHRDDLYDALDRMPLNAQHTALLGVSAIQTVHLLRLAFQDLLTCTLASVVG